VQAFGEDFLPLILLFAISVSGLLLTASYTWMKGYAYDFLALPILVWIRNRKLVASERNHKKWVGDTIITILSILAIIHTKGLRIRHATENRIW
jgi:hypothetical protein